MDVSRVRYHGRWGFGGVLRVGAGAQHTEAEHRDYSQRKHISATGQQPGHRLISLLIETVTVELLKIGAVFLAHWVAAGHWGLVGPLGLFGLTESAIVGRVRRWVDNFFRRVR